MVSNNSNNNRLKKEDIGLSPYQVIFRGKKKTDKILLNVIDYNYDDIKEYDIKSIDELLPFKESNNVSWLNVNGLHDEQLMTEISDVLEIPIYIISDIMNTSIRPKYQEFDNGLFITLKILQYNDKKDEILLENFSIIFCGNLLITFMESKNNIFVPILDRIINHRHKIRHLGIDYLAFSLLDIIVDNYTYIIGLIGDKIEGIDSKLLKKDVDKNILDKITTYKSEILFINKNIKPVNDLFVGVNKLPNIIQKENRIHYKELEDNIVDAIELCDDYRGVLTDQFNVYHTLVGSKLNDIMKTLTVVSLIFSPLSFIAGIYGTNFKVFPEINWTYGYLYMWILIFLTAIAMIIYFKKKNWF